MVDRQVPPNQRKTIAAKTAFIALAAIIAAPGLAATSSRIPCSEAVEATLNVTDTALIIASVSHDSPAPSIDNDTPVEEIAVVSSTSLLGPRAEAAIRDAFSESDSASIDSSDAALSRAMLTPPMAGTESKPQTTTDEDGEEPVSGMNTKLPGISDDALSRYKKQMFRRDI